MVRASRFHLLAILAGGIALPHPVMAGSVACSTPLPAADEKSSPRRMVEPEDLARLRDIGVNDTAFPDARPLALSPDGRHLAFQIRQADPTTNRYCLAMVVMDFRPGAKPLVVDRGGDFLTLPFEFWGKVNFPSGNPKPIEPRWSTDGRWIAFLKRERGVTQVWRAEADGSGSRPVTTSEVDVEDFRIAQDGRSILYASRPSLKRAKEAIDREGLSGFKYGDRFSPMSSNRPFPMTPQPLVYFEQHIDSQPAQPASSEQWNSLEVESGSSSAALSKGSGRRVWLRTLPSSFPPIRQLHAQDRHGQDVTCEALACTGRISRPWWTSDGRRVRFFRREGWGLSATAIYEWVPGGPAPRRIFLTDDVLAGCVPRSSALACLREGSTSPRRIVLLDPATARSTDIFDPNPEFRSLSLGKSERLKWKNDQGIETYGDLVFPVNYRRGTRYPLVIVQYESRGFLRGGTGDEYPIQAFAGRGYAVLSFARPQNVGMFHGAKDPIDNERLNLEGFADRNSVQSSLDLGIQELIDRGIANPQRIGITGLSDGVSTVQYALLHSPRYAAVAISHGSWEATYPISVGPSAMRAFNAAGYPDLTQDNSAFWKAFGLRPNANSISVPILMQVSDDEYLSALEGYTALREVGAPAEMFVFPDEHHIKWQPAHRLAIYRRSLDWFDYWLRDIRPSSPDRQAEVIDWDALKAERIKLALNRSSGGGPVRQ